MKPKPNTCNAESQCYTCGKATTLLCTYINSRNPEAALKKMGVKYKADLGKGVRYKVVPHYQIIKCPLYSFGPLPMIAGTKRQIALAPKPPKEPRKHTKYHEITQLTREEYLEMKGLGMTDKELLGAVGLKYNTWKASLVVAKRDWGIPNYRYNHKPDDATRAHQKPTGTS